ncbi:MAG: LytTR family DNA-binding domain-containing protein [Bacteroidota bacterium]
MPIFSRMKDLNPSLEQHSQIGLLVGLWGFLFAFFTRPFGHGIMDFSKWVTVSLGYSGLIIICYLLVSLARRWWYERKGHWNISWEIGVYALFYFIFTLSSYVFYRSPLVQGFYTIPEYLLKISLNIFLVLTPILFLARRYVQKLAPAKDAYITLYGENKMDVLKIKEQELICISNAQNYVEIFFLEGGQLKKKLIRNSLKNLLAEFDFLIRVHRSHLVNPHHIKSWKDSHTLLLTQLEVPVSKTYKKDIPAL